jgi:hypothetical protein
MGMADIRRELFERHGGFDERLRASEDWDLWIRFIWPASKSASSTSPWRNCVNGPKAGALIRSTGPTTTWQ